MLPSRTMTIPSQVGAVPSGLSCSAVAIAFACTSGPAIGSGDIGVECRSFRLDAVAPTTTILPRTAAGSKSPLSTSTNESVGNVFGPPAQSIQASPSSKLVGRLPGRRLDGLRREAGQPVELLEVLADDAAVVGREVRRADERLAPRRCSAEPPSTSVSPASTSVAASTVPGARAIAS